MASMSNALVFNLIANDLTGPGIGSAEARMARMASMAAMVIGGAAIAVAAASVKMSGDFEAAMERIHTQAGVPQPAIAGLSKGVLDLSVQTGSSAVDMAGAMYHIQSSFASTGITAQRSLEILKIAAEGAKVGNADLVDVTNALDAAIVSGIPGVSDMSSAMGVLNATVGAGDMSMQDLADAMSTGMLASVKGYGLSIRDVGAALAVLGDNNMRGAMAGNQLRMTVQALAAPAKSAKDALAAIGLQTTTLAKDLQRGGLNMALQDLIRHMNESGNSGKRAGAFLTEAFGKRAGAGINVLVGQYDRLESKYTDLTAGSKKFGSAWAATENTFNQHMAKAKASVEVLGIKLGTVLLPAVSKAASWFSSSFVPGLEAAGGWMQKNASWIEPLTAGIAGIVIALTAWKVATAALAVVQAILNVDLTANPIGLIVVAIGAVVGAVLYFWNTNKGFHDFIVASWNVIKNIAISLWVPLKDMVVGAWQAIQGNSLARAALAEVGDGFKQLWEVIKTVCGWVMTAVSWVWNGISSLYMSIAGVEAAGAAVSAGVGKAGAGAAGAVGAVVAASKKIPHAAASGIKSGSGAIKSAAAGMGGAAASGAKSGSASTAKIMEEYGHYLHLGFLKGFKGNQSEIKAVVAGIDQFLKDTIASQKKHLESLQSSYKSLKSAVKDAFAPPDLSAIHTFGDLTSQLAQQLNATRAESANLARLSKMGLSSGLMSQLAQQGTSGAQLAASIIAQGTAGVKQANLLWAQNEQASGQTASNVAGAQYGRQIAQALHNLHIVQEVKAGGHDVDKFVAELIRKYVRTHGGTAAKAFG